ncbi:MAG: isoprenylcysteine carboxylmethyltransferase family protein, partial [Acidobacteria bacterium]|nr:isoprenylcysteine carboxylmethyltransferase family protein [Acidobacteriota bacterium]
SGDPRWINAWIYFGLMVLIHPIYVLVILKNNPEIFNVRNRCGEGTKRYDRVLLLLIFLFMATAYFVAGFDKRHGWSDIPLHYSIIAFVLGLFPYALITWSLATNKHFEPSVRIQNDRNHKVCDRGPYKFIRHPGYAGMVFFSLLVPVMLGSFYAFISAILSIIPTIVRTALEDRTLHKELDGYKEYASRVRYRLVPFIW